MNIFFNMKEYKLLVTLTISIFFSNWRLAEGLKEKPTNGSTGTAMSIFSDILTILINGTVHLIGDCTNDVNATLIEYWLFTQINSKGERITNLEQVDSDKGIKILLHGWNGSKFAPYMVPIKDAYVQRYGANIIMVDFGPYVNSNYQSSYCNAPYVAHNIANFVCQLKTKRQVNMSSIHIVGHSLGGQIAGMVGSRVQDICNGIVGRITGLDPAGPLYEGINRNFRLDKTDAAFVDVIHTNQGQYGYIGQIGHVDFYPNGGTIQPGCLSVLTNFTALANFTLDSIVELPLSFITCNHQRSCYLFAESIIIDSFYSTSVLTCFRACVPDNASPSYCYMGENLRAPPPGKNDQFTCSTRDKPIYGKGRDTRY